MTPEELERQNESFAAELNRRRSTASAVRQTLRECGVPANHSIHSQIEWLANDNSKLLSELTELRREKDGLRRVAVAALELAVLPNSERTWTGLLSALAALAPTAPAEANDKQS